MRHPHEMPGGHEPSDDPQHEPFHERHHHGGRGRGYAAADATEAWDTMRRSHRGPGGPSGRGFGPQFGPPFGPGSHHGRGRRAGRGDTRAAILLLLADGPRHGYQLIQDIEQRTEGRWRPSPGAIYPALAMLEDEGLVDLRVEAGRKQARLTEAGAAYVAERSAELGDPWQAASERPEHPGRAMHEAVSTLAMAAEQVARTGSPTQVQRAAAVLEQARRDLYRLLAEPAEGPTDAPADGT
ncbi:PadR family transcriptional regulator [Cellulomonas composti]|uniref:Transcription regulator PadR N-terminal domain-containing protein n=1 Tax=Cellulomonas composti TaxID=266130 RepID=A0A511J8S9_9CELL|nr:PadR family transcriptional regulator [Cellulomonas composti]GEL94109.1 hypothetical protein CCO02nite_07670 [Cellulomonas composti]